MHRNYNHTCLEGRVTTGVPIEKASKAVTPIPNGNGSKTTVLSENRY